ncbi:hypothetical protein Lal_00043948 [Lupinus albus]|nr:hypothetical protein Lal_00043948 [Lupinus albus]
MPSFRKSSSLGRSSNPNFRSSELSDPMRRSFTGNPFSKPSSLIANSRTFVPTTPANTPTGSHIRNSVGGRKVLESFFSDHDENKENGKGQFLKASKAQSSAASSKSAKNFMSPTISVASKVAISPKKKVLADRNEPSATSVLATAEAKSPIIRKVTFAEPLQCSDLKSENGVEQKMFVTSSFDGLPTEEMHFATSLSCEELSGEAAIFDMNSPFKSKNDTEFSFQTVADEPDCVILDPSFNLSPTPTPPPPLVSSTISTLAPPHADPLSPPYDPKTNYLSPRPQFLHYKPKPQMEREGENLMFDSFSDTEATEDTQSEEGSQKSMEVSSDEVIKAKAGISELSPAKTSDEVIKAKAGISELSPAKTSLAEETVEAREVPKPHSFMKSTTFIVLLLLFSAVAIISVSITNSSVMDHTVFQGFYKVYESSNLSEYAKANFDQYSQFAKAKIDVPGLYFHTWYTKSLSLVSEVISNFRGVHHLDYLNLTVFQDFYKVYELSDLSRYAKANFGQFSQFAKAKFDVSARYFYTWYTKLLSSISKVIFSVREVHHLGRLQYYNLTVLQESNVFDQEPIFGPGKMDIVEIELPGLNNEESDTALESEDYKSEFDQQDVGVATPIIASVPELEESLEGGQPATMIELYQPLQVAEVSELNQSSEVVVLYVDVKPSLDAKAADIHSEVIKIGNLAATMTQVCDVVDNYSNVAHDDQPSLHSDIAEIDTAEARDNKDMQLAEAEGVNADKYSDVGLKDQLGLDAKAADIHNEVIKIGNLAATTTQVCDIVDNYSNVAHDDQPSLHSDVAEINTAEARDNKDMELAEAEGVNTDKYSDVGLKDQLGLNSNVAEIHTEDSDIELTEAEGESASIDATLEDNEQRLETTDFLSHLMLYLLLCGGTVAGLVFKWSRKVISKKTKVTSSINKPVFAKAAFYSKSLPTPKEYQSFLDKPSLRNEPTEIDLHEELHTSEMSNIQKNSYKQKVVKGPTEIDLHEELHTSEMSSIQKNSHKQKVLKELNEVNRVDNRPTSSSSEDSISPSYGSFTTYSKIKIKRGHGEEETITPLRRSSRVRSKVTSLLSFTAKLTCERGNPNRLEKRYIETEPLSFSLKSLILLFWRTITRQIPSWLKPPSSFNILWRNSFYMSERRQAEASRIREKYPDRIPVIVEKAERNDIPDIDKKKYLVPADLTVGQFVYVVRKRIKLSAEKAIFVFINNTLPPTAAMMSAIYEENKDQDGFLYMTYSGENTFGSQ